MSARASENDVKGTTQQLERLQSRGFQLWSIGFLTMLILAMGVLSFVVPNLNGPARPVYVQFSYLPQLCAGLVALVVLLNLYLGNQQRAAEKERIELVRKSAMEEAVRQTSILDPVTHLLDRRYLEHILPVETARMNRSGDPLTFMLIAATSLPDVRERLGSEAADVFLMEAARVLKSTFRGSDVVLRHDAVEFLVLMPSTTEQQASVALRRLVARVDDWNLNTQASWEMLLDCKMVACGPGQDPWATLRKAEQEIFISTAEFHHDVESHMSSK